MKPILIGITGRARSGKDTAADVLKYRLGLHKYALGGPLKDMLKTGFGDHFHEGDRDGICKETGVSYRRMMQTLGTEWGRGLNDNIWLNLAQTRWEQIQKSKLYAGMVISDVRFPNEAEWIRERGGKVLEIIRPGQPIVESNHPSEQRLPVSMVHWVIHNYELARFVQDVHVLADGEASESALPLWRGVSGLLIAGLML